MLESNMTSKKMESKSEDWETSLASPFTGISGKNLEKSMRKNWKCRTFEESSYSASNAWFRAFSEVKKALYNDI